MAIDRTYISPLVLHLSVDCTRVDGENVDVVVVGLDDLFEDGLGVKDHGKLSCKRISFLKFSSAIHDELLTLVRP